MNLNLLCRTCRQPLSGRQKLFCSRRCKNADTNRRHQSYRQQQLRGWARKRQLLGEAGGKCSRCGYARNSAALGWHHLDAEEKGFSLDIRSLSNRSETEIRAEIQKCIVVCANCHAELHHPQFDTGARAPLKKKPAVRRVSSRS